MHEDEPLPRHPPRHPAHGYEPLLPNYLEADQLVAETSRPVPESRLGARATTALWALRVFVVVLSAMVIYVFISQTVG